MTRRILYVVTTDAYFLSHRLPVALAAQKAGFEVLVAAKDTGKAKEIESHFFQFAPLKRMNRTGLNPFADFRAFLELLFLYTFYRPHVVHHVALKPVLYGSLAAFIARVPRVVNALTGLGYLYISKKRSIRFTSRVVTGFFRFLFNRPNSLLIVQNRDDFKKFNAFVPKKRLALIRGSGVDVTVHTPPSKDMKGPPFKVGLASRMLWDKGLGEAIEAMRLLKEEGADVEFILCGDPDPQNPRSVDVKTLYAWEKEGLCHWFSHLSDVVTLYQKSDVALLPSYREGLPKTLLEAAACGAPIITTDVPGCREVVEEGKNGFLVPLDDTTPKAIYDAIKWLMEHPLEKARMGAHSRAMAEKHFASELICEQTLAVYG